MNVKAVSKEELRQQTQTCYMMCLAPWYLVIGLVGKLTLHPSVPDGQLNQLAKTTKHILELALLGKSTNISVSA